jgi:DNA-binding transcriptional ArsR family regulator
MSIDHLVGVLKALADPTRVLILTHLADGGLCVGALAYRLGVTHSAISQHLRILREAGFVDGERQGYRVHYSLDRDRIREASAQVAVWMERLGTVAVEPRAKTSAKKTRQSRGDH